MKTFEQFLHDNSSQTSLSCLLDSLNNWKKSTLTFKDAVNTVELMAYYIDILTKENEELRRQNINLLKRLKNKLEKASIYADSSQRK